jgi:hypothetical protein
MREGFARGALIACVGAIFIGVAVWFYASRILSDLQTGHAVLNMATRTHITWSHTYGLRDHPVYFSVKMLKDASGAIAFGGLGLFLLYVVVRSARAQVSTRAKRIGTVWVVVCLASFVLHLMLLGFPYLLRAGILL